MFKLEFSPQPQAEGGTYSLSMTRQVTASAAMTLAVLTSSLQGKKNTFLQLFPLQSPDFQHTGLFKNLEDKFLAFTAFPCCFHHPYRLIND